MCSTTNERPNLTAANSRRAWHFDCHEYYHVIGFGHVPLRRLWLSFSLSGVATRMAVFLNQIVPWGRSRAEYDLMFSLEAGDLSAGVLDGGGGPASFTAELSAAGIRAVSVDPSDFLSEAFHIRSVLELCRVAREVRLFPLLTLRHEPSPHLAAVRSALEAEGWTSKVVSVEYERQRGGNQMLSVFRTGPRLLTHDCRKHRTLSQPNV